MQLLQTQYKSEADVLTAALDFEGLVFWITRRNRPRTMIPGRMLYLVHVKQRDAVQAHKIKADTLFFGQDR